MGLFILITALSMIFASATAQGCTSDDVCMNNGTCYGICFCTTGWTGTYCDDRVYTQITDSPDGGGHSGNDSSWQQSCHSCVGEEGSDCANGWDLDYSTMEPCSPGVYTCETAYWVKENGWELSYSRGCSDMNECEESWECYDEGDSTCRTCCYEEGCNTDTSWASGASQITGLPAGLVAGFITIVMSYM